MDFPRTKVQVECLKMFYDQMILAAPGVFRHARRPIISGSRCSTSWCSSSMRRKASPASSSAAAKRSCTTPKSANPASASCEEERNTDFDPELARNRYRTFKEKTYDALVSLKQIFHYHFINAQAPIEVVQQNIIRELEYQSSLELDPRTYDTLRHIPLADEIVQRRPPGTRQPAGRLSGRASGVAPGRRRFHPG